MKRISAIIAIFLAAAGSSAALAEPAATVTEAVNDVTRGSSKAAGTEAAQIGSKLGDGQYLKTGVKSRAELQLANLTVTRLGANTIFDYSPGANEIDLQTGTVLFSKPKDSAQMTIKTAAVTAAVLGTTGFAQLHGKTFIFGIIEGHAKVVIGGVTYSVGPGDVLRMAGNAPPQIAAYNVPHFLETSPLISDFHSQLPNQAYINKAVARYDNLVARGFITPPTHPAFAGTEGGVTVIPTLAIDSQAEACYLSNVQGAAPTPPLVGPSGQVEFPARPQEPYNY